MSFTPPTTSDGSGVNSRRVGRDLGFAGQGDGAVLKGLASQSMTERRTAAEEVHADHLATLAGDRADDLALQAGRASQALRARTFGELAGATHGLTRTGPA